jgi:dTDP-glucose 4,6-dehydratase
MAKKKILITGGAGFIGSHLVRLMLEKYPDYHIVNLDKLTYAGNLENLSDVDKKPNYTFEKGDIVDAEFIDGIFKKYDFDGVIHLAAESHVDRSIENPLAFIETNILGTMNLLNAARNNWKDMTNKRFYHVSTEAFLSRRRRMTHGRPIRLPRRVLTTWFERITTHTNYRLLSPIVPIIMDRISFQKN